MIVTVQAEEIDKQKSSEKIDTVVALGLVMGDDTGELHLEDTFTRAEMATLVYRLRFPDMEATVSKQIFQDVSRYFWAAGYIEKLFEFGVVKGDGTGNFRPNDPISMAETCMMFLNLAGYSAYIDEIAGGYPTGVMTTAQNVKLNSDVPGSADHILTRR